MRARFFPFPHSHPKRNFSSYAAGDIFVPLCWACGTYTICVKSDGEITSSNAWRSLITSMAILLDIILGSEAKFSLQRGTLVRVRRALRSVFDFR